MPFPNEHAARVRIPGDFQPDSFKRKEIKPGIDIIIGRLKGEDTMTTQAYRFDKTKFTVEEAKKWLKDNDIKVILFEPAKETTEAETAISIKELENKECITLKDKEICAVGTFNASTGKIKITKDILIKMAENYNKLKDKLKVPFILGHSSYKKGDSMAAGWLENLRVVGNKLVSDITKVPKTIAEAIKNGRYRGVSIEAVSKWVDGTTGEAYNHVLTALAALGVKEPAVPGLNDFNVTFESENQDAYSIFFASENSKASEEDDNKNKRKEDKKEMEKTQELEKQNAKLEAEKKAINDELEATKAAKLEAEKQLQAEQKKIKDQKIAIFLEANSTEKCMKILPKSKEKVKAILENLTSDVIKFEAEGKTIEKPLDEIFMELITDLPHLVEFEERSTADKGRKSFKTDPNSNFDVNSDKAHALAVELQTKEDINYELALERVYKENPELLKEEG
jgi:hypothetical protein